MSSVNLNFFIADRVRHPQDPRTPVRRTNHHPHRRDRQMAHQDRHHKIENILWNESYSVFVFLDSRTSDAFDFYNVFRNNFSFRLRH